MLQCGKSFYMLLLPVIGQNRGRHGKLTCWEKGRVAGCHVAAARDRCDRTLSVSQSHVVIHREMG